MPLTQSYDQVPALADEFLGKNNLTTKEAYFRSVGNILSSYEGANGDSLSLVKNTAAGVESYLLKNAGNFPDTDRHAFNLALLATGSVTSTRQLRSCLDTVISQLHAIAARGDTATTKPCGQLFTEVANAYLSLQKAPTRT